MDKQTSRPESAFILLLMQATFWAIAGISAFPFVLAGQPFLIGLGLASILLAGVAAFLAIGLLSVPPTLAYLRWRRVAPQAGQIAVVRRYLYAEVALFAPLLAFAAAMARGYGEF